jgi:LuxR family transcriptional regulator
MYRWQEDHMQGLLQIQDEGAFLKALTGIAEDLGYDFCSYGMRMPLPMSHPKVVMLSSPALAWQRDYLESCVDPGAGEKRKPDSMTPHVWSGEQFSGNVRFFEQVRNSGLNSGWAQSTYDVRGIAGLLTLGLSHSYFSVAELQDKALQTFWLAQLAHKTLARLLIPKYLPEVSTQLTSREVEVLRWSADGKTSGEIGNIMSISERTVNFHVNNALVKLGASNKTSGVIKAAILGFL